MGLFETEALVLRTYNLAEADKIVVCLTRSSGLIRGVARGSRKLKNRFGAGLEPFTLINLTFYQKENQELVSLRQAEILCSRFNLLGEAETLAGLAYMGDLVMEFSPPYQRHEKLFRMVKACVDAVAKTPTDLEFVLRYFEIWILKLEGFLPDLKHCSNCHSLFSDTESVVISHDLALNCTNCKQGSDQVISQGVHRQLKASEKLAPYFFAQQLREVSRQTNRELAELTQRIIRRVLDRQPKLRSTLN